MINLQEGKFEVSDQEILQNSSKSGKFSKSRKIEILSTKSDQFTRRKIQGIGSGKLQNSLKSGKLSHSRDQNSRGQNCHGNRGWALKPEPELGGGVVMMNTGTT